MLEKKRFVFLGMFLLVLLLGFVVAEDTVCCLDSSNPLLFCQDVLSTTCSNPSFNTCTNTPSCMMGCCVDSDSGTCDSNVESQCIAGEGTWNLGACSNVNDCDQICCWIDGEAGPMGREECKQTAIDEGEDYLIDTTTIIEDCHGFAGERGACVSDSICTIITDEECDGDFLEGKLCSSDEVKDLNVNYEGGYTQECDFEAGLTGVYYFDSHGNRENLIGAGYDHGDIIEDEDVADDAEGNCKLENSYICSDEGGDAECVYTGCSIDDNERTIEDERDHLESWCIYDGYVGNSRDTVGSEQFMATCVGGEVIIESCGEYRTGLCAERIIGEGDDAKSEAQCRKNLGDLCNEIDNEVECNNNFDCRIEHYSVTMDASSDKGYFETMCVAKYPIGAEIIPLLITGSGEDVDVEDVADAAAAIGRADVCSLGQRNCDLYKRRGEESFKNKFCKSWIFPYEANNLCVALGDCGRWVNTLENEEGYNEDHILISSDYISLAEPPFASSNTATPYDYQNWFSDLPENQIGGEYNFKNDEIENFNDGGGIGDEKYNKKNTPDFIVDPEEFDSLQIPLPSELKIMDSDTNIDYGSTGDWYEFSIGPPDTVRENEVVVEDTEEAASSEDIGNAYTKVDYEYLSSFYDDGFNNIDVVAQCRPWQPSAGGDNCDECNDQIVPCTPYKCNSLGADCRIKTLSEDLIEDAFVEIEDFDTGEMDRQELLGYSATAPEEEKLICYNYLDNEESEVTIAIENAPTSCVEENEKIEFNIITDIESICRYSLEDISYDTMNNPIEGGWSDLNKFVSLEVPMAEEEEEDYTIYIQCKSPTDTISETTEVDFIVCEKVDLFYPVVYGVKLNSEDDFLDEDYFLKYGEAENSVDLNIYINEDDGICRSSLTPGVSFAEMGENIGCSPNSFNTICGPITIGDLNLPENKIYIKCSDLDDNVMLSDYPVVIKKTQSPLEIATIKLDGYDADGYSRDVPISADIPLNLDVVTTGGAYSGKSQCSYNSGGDDFFYQEFGDADSTIHSETFRNVLPSQHTLHIKCEDDAGNTNKTTISFEYELDEEYPIILQKYVDGGKLKVVTNEDAECTYRFDECPANVTDGTSMTGIVSMNHEASVYEGVTYHILCEDIYENEMDICEEVFIV
jgi:hypothetical protein